MNLFERLAMSETVISSTESIFEFKPFSPGMATTAGNSLRRVLLSSLPGCAARAIRIEGARHELTALECVKEDVPEIVLNVKELVFTCNSTWHEAEAHIVKSGTGKITGADIELPAGFEVVNPDKLIATLDERDSFKMTLFLNTGIGFVEAADNEFDTDSINGIIAVDSLYSPVVRCAVSVEQNWRQSKTESLKLDVETNGAISPAEAVRQAASLIAELMEACKALTAANSDSFGTVAANERENTSVKDLGLTKGSEKGVLNAGINTTGELARYGKRKLNTIPGMGPKSIEKIEKKLSDLGLSLAE